MVSGDALGGHGLLEAMRRQWALRERLLHQGDAPLGWKAGFGSPAAMARWGTKGPLVGFLTRGRLVENGAVVSLDGWVQPAAEAEIAVYMGRDVEAGADPEAVSLAIAALGPAIELVDIGGMSDQPEEILAANIYHRHVVLGPRDERRAGGRVEGLAGRVLRGSEVVTCPDLTANTGPLPAIVRHIADVLGSLGERLRSGEVIIAGAVVPPMLLTAADQAIAFDLAPIGQVSVRFR